MKINFRSKYLDYGYIINNIVKPNNKLDIYFFHFFKNNQLLYTKKMVYGYNYYNHHFNHYRISKSILNSFYDNNYKISYIHYVILLTNIYVNKNQRLIYINTYRNNSFSNFIIGDYYKFRSREYIDYCRHIYYQIVVGNFYYYNYYITKQEINDMQEQLKTCSKSIELLYIL